MATLVVALDMPEASQALDMAYKLSGLPVWLKVGLELFSLAGPDLVHSLKDKGFSVFLDLKLFDIPHTVQSAVSSAQRMGVDMLTIHAMGGERMARAALEGIDTSKPNAPLIMGVTVLTSTAQGELPGYTGDIGVLATNLARHASNWGLHGVVCSGFEVPSIKAQCPANFLCLTPGIRLADSSADDQRRIMTPRQAVQAGANFLVVGRPITRSPHPDQITQRIVDEMEAAYCQRTAL
ncbi:MAG: orotidine-5'-phosphate decarboxylase [Desulfovibrionaceae bacterium]